MRYRKYTAVRKGEIPMGNERKSDFSGSWYPGNPRECISIIEQFIEESSPCPKAKRFVGGIVPHAGWVFSGKIACSVIKCLKTGKDPDTCVIFGRHLHPGGENYIMENGSWSTPLGPLEIDEDFAVALIKDFPFVVETSSRYEPDNTIELQLPFIKYFFPETRIVPIGVPPTKNSLDIARKVVAIAEEKGRNIIALGSTDLTHYGYNYGFMPEGSGKSAVEWVKKTNDKQIVDIMLNMDSQRVIEEALENHNACCSGAAAAAIEAAKALGAKEAEKVVYSTSYDISPGDSFVGYAGILFEA
jgi:AmmeMemoRadiSam system protein B